jgi:hypothetical protein
MISTDPFRFESVLDRFSGRGGMHYLDVPEEIARQFSGKGPVRVICTLNGTVEYPCALMRTGLGQYFVYVGKPVMKRAGIAAGATVEASLRKDDSPYGMELPEELKELLELDEEGNRRFHELTPGKQRGIIYYIASARTVNTRIERAIKQLDKLKIPRKR